VNYVDFKMHGATIKKKNNMHVGMRIAYKVLVGKSETGDIL